MENASKALIIAGAILISIVLIGIGVLIVNSTGGITDEVGQQFSSQEKEAFNRQFETYESTSTNAGNARALLSRVISSNATNKDSGKLVKVNAGSGDKDTAADISTIRSELNNSYKYKIELVYSAGGLVNVIKITKL